MVNAVTMPDELLDELLLDEVDVLDELSPDELLVVEDEVELALLDAEVLLLEDDVAELAALLDDALELAELDAELLLDDVLLLDVLDELLSPELLELPLALVPEEEEDPLEDDEVLSPLLPP